ncbi:hypothetical protein [Obesumbacterium proteus]|uniref:hypothetical protein n=1 Tax=Obesumbacterium proteus TaxID=82983 RepID=UPI00242E0884|nr:hypothetical protein [Obesumbacterium proteus]
MNINSLEKLALSASLVLCSALFSGIASAAFSVYPISVTTNQQGGAQIKVISASAEMDFIKVTVKTIENPGTKEEKERDLAAGESLVVTPAKFGLSAGTTRIVRLVNMVPPESEQAYRVYFEPVNNLDTTSSSEAQKNKIGVNITWGALVIVPPVKPVEDISYIPVNRQFVNNGNVHITLSEVGVCKSSSDSNNCKWTKDARTVYPGQKLLLKDTEAQSFSPASTVKIKYVSSITQTMLERQL